MSKLQKLQKQQRRKGGLFSVQQRPFANNLPKVGEYLFPELHLPITFRLCRPEFNSKTHDTSQFSLETLLKYELDLNTSVRFLLENEIHLPNLLMPATAPYFNLYEQIFGQALYLTDNILPFIIKNRNYMLFECDLKTLPALVSETLGDQPTVGKGQFIPKMPFITLSWLENHSFADVLASVRQAKAQFNRHSTDQAEQDEKDGKENPYTLTFKFDEQNHKARINHALADFITRFTNTKDNDGNEPTDEQYRQQLLRLSTLPTVDLPQKVFRAIVELCQDYNHTIHNLLVNDCYSMLTELWQACYNYKGNGDYHLPSALFGAGMSDEALKIGNDANIYVAGFSDVGNQLWRNQATTFYKLLIEPIFNGLRRQSHSLTYENILYINDRLTQLYELAKNLDLVQDILVQEPDNNKTVINDLRHSVVADNLLLSYTATSLDAQSKNHFLYAQVLPLKATGAMFTDRAGKPINANSILQVVMDNPYPLDDTPDQFKFPFVLSHYENDPDQEYETMRFLNTTEFCLTVNALEMAWRQLFGLEL